MAVEGLRIVLEKEAVVGTPTAEQLVQSPEAILAAFSRHVRSYVPFGRAAGASDDSPSVADFEKRLIALVREAKAPKGYITADFGYGKTSTALYLWHRCREAGLLAVPPFRLSKLEDLILATYGWARFDIGRRAPALVERVELLYQRYCERSVEADAGGDVTRAELLRTLLREGRYTLALTTIDYLNFFDQLSALALEAGYGGLVILPDEVQQYLEPTIRAGVPDPIAPLFDLVQGFVTRKGSLPTGIIFSIPAKELGVINDQRADLVQRLKMDGLGLDLRAIYDRGFAARLWERLAREFEFTEDTVRIVVEETLDSLGEIASRDDLANGPRTVIAAFSMMIRRYLDAREQLAPLTPIGLVDAFLAGEIVFDNVGKLQSVIQEHLSSRLAATRPEFRDAIKLLGAFPTDGASPATLEAAGLAEAANELSRIAQGDMVITVGGGRDSHGRVLPYGLTLRGLEPSHTNPTDWLSRTIREFRRDYIESADSTLQRAERAFARLLTTIVFREPEWQVIRHEGMSDGGGISLVVEGQYRSQAKRFPERRVRIRLLREHAQVALEQDTDALIDIVLARHPTGADHLRGSVPGSIVLAEDGKAGYAQLTLNLFHRDSDLFYPDLQATLQPILDPRQLTPLLLLALDESLEEKRRQGAIPKEDDREIARTFQPILLDHATSELLNAELGTAYGASNERILEELLRRTWEARYPDYHTLIVQQNWRGALRDYETALERLPGPDERQGKEQFAATKSEVARIFNRTNAGLDTFTGIFPELITVTKPFRATEAGAIRFLLHPFEERLRSSLKSGAIDTTRKVRRVSLKETYGQGRALGYRQAEIDALIEILTARGAIEVSVQRDEICEVVPPQLRFDDLETQIAALLQRIVPLQETFSDEALLQNQLKNLNAMAREVKEAPASFDERKLRARLTTIRGYATQLEQFLRTTQQALSSDAHAMGNIPVADLQQEYALAQPLSSRLFGGELDVQRLSLDRQARALYELQQQARAEAQTIQLRLEETKEGAESIRQAKTDLAVLRRKARDLDTGVAKLQIDCRRFVVVKRVLDGLIDLDQQLRLVGGENSPADTNQISQDLGALHDQIATALRGDKLAALEAAAVWEGELLRFRGLFSRQQELHREAFENRKAHYHELLHTFLALPRDAFPLTAVYNPTAPHDSTRRLTNDVTHQLDTVCRRLLQILENWAVGLRQLLASPDLAEADDPAGNLANRCRDILQNVDAARGSILQRQVQSLDTTILEDIDTEHGRCEQLFAAISGSAQDVLALAPRYQALQAQIEPSKLDARERGLLDALRQMTTTGEAALEMGSLLQAGTFTTQSKQEVWELLQKLYLKRRIQLHITLSPGSG